MLIGIVASLVFIRVGSWIAVMHEDSDRATMDTGAEANTSELSIATRDVL